MLLAVFADLYRQEVGAEEDVHRTLPFFGTALGIVIGALAYAAGRLPKWPDVSAGWPGTVAFVAPALLLGLAVVEAGCVLFWVSRAVARRDYRRIGPETALRARLVALQAYYDGQGVEGEQRDTGLLEDMQLMLLDSYTAVTQTNRGLNQRRYRFRALASSHPVRRLIGALAASDVIVLADKLGFLPKVTP